MKPTKALILTATLAANLMATEPLTKEFTSNGVQGAIMTPKDKIVVLVRPSNCNVEGVTVKVRVKKDKADSTFRLFVKSESAYRCQQEPLMFTFDRDADEVVVLVAVHELVVSNNATAPVN